VAEQEWLVRRVRQARDRLSEGQLFEESAATVGSYNGITEPVGRWQVPQVCVQRGARGGARMVIARICGLVARFDERNVPVPMQHGHVIGVVGGGVPPEEMIVVDAYLVGRVMVANIVIIGLRQGYVNHAQNQNSDSESSRTSKCGPA
jgi:hypothetical protein